MQKTWIARFVANVSGGRTQCVPTVLLKYQMEAYWRFCRDALRASDKKENQ